jgi:putative transposase
VRAGIVEKPENWPWSSAAAHCGCASPDSILELECWRKRWSAPEWRCFLAQAESAIVVAALRQFTHTGRPLGTPAFVSGLEASMLRPLAARKPGRPNKAADPHQLSLVSGA